MDKDFEKQMKKLMDSFEKSSKEIGVAFKQPLKVMVSEGDDIEELAEKEVNKVIDDIFDKNFQ